MNIPPISFALDDYIEAKILAAKWDHSDIVAIGMGNPTGLSRLHNTWGRPLPHPYKYCADPGYFYRPRLA